tara:strand:+ start:255 stop:1076 length:822 start_codon:yes stop_codon:yes gene_type:complete
MSDIEKIINDAWENRKDISPNSDKKIIDTINDTIQKLDEGKIRTANRSEDGKWITNQVAKKAILLSFRTSKMTTTTGPYATWFDKVPGKTQGWTVDDHRKAGFRQVPNGVIRKGSYIAPGVVCMPSFVNIGAYVDSGTMVDTWVTVGSGAQIGKNCHLSGGVGIGGVLEPVQAGPTIIEDGCFIGARSEIVEGVIVRKNSVISMGVFIGSSTKIVRRDTGEILMGEVPEGSVVVPGALPSKKPGSPSLYCAVIIKTVDEKTRSKTSLNELLRD